jgi:hypothetical protein
MTSRDRGFLAELRKKVAIFLQGTETYWENEGYFYYAAL